MYLEKFKYELIGYLAPLIDKSERRQEWIQPFLCDGLHFSPSGNQVLFQLLMKTIEENVPELHPDKLQHFVKYHFNISISTI